MWLGDERAKVNVNCGGSSEFRTHSTLSTVCKSFIDATSRSCEVKQPPIDPFHLCPGFQAIREHYVTFINYRGIFADVIVYIFAH